MLGWLFKCAVHVNSGCVKNDVTTEGGGREGSYSFVNIPPLLGLYKMFAKYSAGF